MTKRAARIVAVAGLTVGLAAPAAAEASSLVLLRPDGNVWLANPDGSGLYQVTLDGTPGDPYESPSQADDGTIVAIRGNGENELIIRMKQNGQVLSAFKPAVEFSMGLFGADVSRDGSKVAYSTGWLGSPSCTPGQTGLTICLSTEVTSSTGPVPMGGLVQRINPSWASGSRLLVAHVNYGLYTWDLGEAEVSWFDTDRPNDPELTVDGTRLAHTASTSNPSAEELLVVRQTTGNPITDEPGPGAPSNTGCVFTGPAGGQFNDPTWAPSGTGVAWEEGDDLESTAPGPGEGIWVWSGVDLAGCTGTPSAPAIPGGSEPDWGPADINPGPRVPPDPPKPPCCTPPADRTAPVLEGALALGSRRFAAAPSGPSIARAAVGTTVSYRLSEAASVTFTVERSAPGRKVGRRCVKPSRRNRSRPRCTRYVRLRGSFSHRGQAGRNSFKFTGRLAGRKLRPGSYRLVAVARDAAGNASAAKRVSFRIVRR
jgi:hypothetical protein